MSTSKTQLRDDGYVLAREVLSPEDIQDVLRACALPFERLAGHADIENTRVCSWSDLHALMRSVKWWNQHAFLQALRASQSDARILRAATGPNLIATLQSLGLGAPAVALKPFPILLADDLFVDGGYNLRPFHQEWPVMQGSTDGVVVWIALHDIDDSHHALEVIPGSHEHGVLQYERSKCGTQVVQNELPERKPKRLHIKGGDAVVFSAFTCHRTSPVGAGFRASLTIRFNNLEAPDYAERLFPDPSKLEIQREPLDGFRPSKIVRS